MKKSWKAFTLTELLVVVVIIGVLAAVVLPKFTKMLDARKTMEAESVMTAIRNEQEARCSTGRNYALVLNTSVVKDSKAFRKTGTGFYSKNFKYKNTMGRGGISAESTKGSYKLEIPSYADGRVCCSNVKPGGCDELGKSYPLCSELRKKADFVAANAACTVGSDVAVCPFEGTADGTEREEGECGCPNKEKGHYKYRYDAENCKWVNLGCSVPTDNCDSCPTPREECPDTDYQFWKNCTCIKCDPEKNMIHARNEDGDYIQACACTLGDSDPTRGYVQQRKDGERFCSQNADPDGQVYWDNYLASGEFQTAYSECSCKSCKDDAVGDNGISKWNGFEVDVKSSDGTYLGCSACPYGVDDCVEDGGKVLKTEEDGSCSCVTCSEYDPTNKPFSSDAKSETGTIDGCRACNLEDCDPSKGEHFVYVAANGDFGTIDSSFPYKKDGTKKESVVLSGEETSYLGCACKTCQDLGFDEGVISTTSLANCKNCQLTQCDESKGEHLIYRDLEGHVLTDSDTKDAFTRCACETCADAAEAGKLEGWDPNNNGWDTSFAVWDQETGSCKFCDQDTYPGKAYPDCSVSDTRCLIKSQNEFIPYNTTTWYVPAHDPTPASCDDGTNYVVLKTNGTIDSSLTSSILSMYVGILKKGNYLTDRWYSISVVNDIKTYNNLFIKSIFYGNSSAGCTTGWKYSPEGVSFGYICTSGARKRDCACLTCAQQGLSDYTWNAAVPYYDGGTIKVSGKDYKIAIMGRCVKCNTDPSSCESGTSFTMTDANGTNITAQANAATDWNAFLGQHPDASCECKPSACTKTSNDCVAQGKLLVPLQKSSDGSYTKLFNSTQFKGYDYSYYNTEGQGSFEDYLKVYGSYECGCEDCAFITGKESYWDGNTCIPCDSNKVEKWDSTNNKCIRCNATALPNQGKDASGNAVGDGSERFLVPLDNDGNIMSGSFVNKTPTVYDTLEDYITANGDHACAVKSCKDLYQDDYHWTGEACVKCDTDEDWNSTLGFCVACSKKPSECDQTKGEFFTISGDDGNRTLAQEAELAEKGQSSTYANWMAFLGEQGGRSCSCSTCAQGNPYPWNSFGWNKVAQKCMECTEETYPCDENTHLVTYDALYTTKNRNWKQGYSVVSDDKTSDWAGFVSSLDKEKLCECKTCVEMLSLDEDDAAKAYWNGSKCMLCGTGKIWDQTTSQCACDEDTLRATCSNQITLADGTTKYTHKLVADEAKCECQCDITAADCTALGKKLEGCACVEDTCPAGTKWFPGWGKCMCELAQDKDAWGTSYRPLEADPCASETDSNRHFVMYLNSLPWKDLTNDVKRDGWAYLGNNGILSSPCGCESCGENYYWDKNAFECKCSTDEIRQTCYKNQQVFSEKACACGTCDDEKDPVLQSDGSYKCVCSNTCEAGKRLNTDTCECEDCTDPNLGGENYVWKDDAMTECECSLTKAPNTAKSSCYDKNPKTYFKEADCTCATCEGNRTVATEGANAYKGCECNLSCTGNTILNRDSCQCEDCGSKQANADHSACVMCGMTQEDADTCNNTVDSNNEHPKHFVYYSTLSNGKNLLASLLSSFNSGWSATFACQCFDCSTVNENYVWLEDATWENYTGKCVCSPAKSKAWKEANRKNYVTSACEFETCGTNQKVNTAGDGCEFDCPLTQAECAAERTTGETTWNAGSVLYSDSDTNQCKCISCYDYAKDVRKYPDDILAQYQGSTSSTGEFGGENGCSTIACNHTEKECHENGQVLANQNYGDNKDYSLNKCECVSCQKYSQLAGEETQFSAKAKYVNGQCQECTITSCNGGTHLVYKNSTTSLLQEAATDVTDTCACMDCVAITGESPATWDENLSWVYNSTQTWGKCTFCHETETSCATSTEHPGYYLSKNTANRTCECKQCPQSSYHKSSTGELDTCKCDTAALLASCSTDEKINTTDTNCKCETCPDNYVRDPNNPTQCVCNPQQRSACASNGGKWDEENCTCQMCWEMTSQGKPTSPNNKNVRWSDSLGRCECSLTKGDCPDQVVVSVDNLGNDATSLTDYYWPCECMECETYGKKLGLDNKGFISTDGRACYACRGD